MIGSVKNIGTKRVRKVLHMSESRFKGESRSRVASGLGPPANGPASEIAGEPFLTLSRRATLGSGLGGKPITFGSVFDWTTVELNDRSHPAAAKRKNLRHRKTHEHILRSIQEEKERVFGHGKRNSSRVRTANRTSVELNHRSHPSAAKR